MVANAVAYLPASSTGAPVATTGTANTSRVDPPTASSIADGPAAGVNQAIVTQVHAVSTVANAAGLFQVWLKISSTYYLLAEVVTSAVTPSTTVAAATAVWIPPDGSMILKSGEKLAFSISKAEVWTVYVEQKDY